jgi:hypothetical protein
VTAVRLILVRAHTQGDARKLWRALGLRGHETSPVLRARKAFVTSATQRQIDRLAKHLQIGPWFAMSDQPPRPEEVSLHAIRQLFETSNDADVVRAAVRAVASSLPSVRYLTRDADETSDQGRALATLAAAWHAYTQPRPR